MFYVYIVAAAALIPIINNFTPLLSRPDSWWLCPLLVAAFFLGFIILHLAVFAVSILLIDPDGNPDRFAKYYRFITDHTLPLLFKLARINIHTSGAELVPDGRFLLVCNHTNDFDPAIIINELPEAELGFVAKKDIYSDLPFVARLMHKLHCLPIDRENNREAVKTIINAANYIKDDKISVGIFPEGYTSRDGNLQPYRNGAFKIAYKAHAPIVVCTLSGTFMVHKRIFLHKSDIYLDILKTLPYEEYGDKSSSEVGDHIHSLMEENLNKYKSKS